MELTLSTETVKYYKTVLKKSVSHEETMEMIVPDAQPELARVIAADGVVMLRGKEAVSGKVSVSGQVNGAVLYSAEDSMAVLKMEYSLPFVISAENPEITSDTEVMVKLLLTGIDAKTVNTRKIILRANVEACLDCLNQTELTLSCGIKNADDSSIETLCRSEHAVPVSLVTEKRFVVTDEYKLQTAKPALDEILSSNVSVLCDDVKTVGNKLIVKGTAYVTMLYAGKDDTGVASAEFQSVFSQILELDSKCDDASFTVEIAVTGVYLNADDYNATGEQCIMAEIHAVAQCKAYLPMDLDLMTDLYSTKYDLDITREEFEIMSLERRDTVSEVFRDIIPVTEPVKTILSSTVQLGCMEVMPTESGSKIVGTACVTVRYISENDMLMAASKRGPMEMKLEDGEDLMLTVSASYRGDIYLTITADGIEARYSVDFSLSKFRMLQDSTITSVSLDESKTVDNSEKPSLVVRPMVYGDTLWTLAKRYSSTRALIISANAMEADADVTEGMLLIIPKKR